MKDFKKDSSASSNLSRFGRDKRVRTTSSSFQREERSPRSQRDAADSGKPGSERRSFNPNFTRENRPTSGGERKPYGERKSFGGERPSFNREGGEERRPYGERKSFGGDRTERRSFGDKPSFNRGGGEERKPYGERKSFGGDRTERRSFGDKPSFNRGGGEERKPYGERKSFGGDRSERKPYGERTERRSFGDKPAYGRKPFSKAQRSEGNGDEQKSYPKYDPNKQVGEMRLNRYLAQSGLCSRREADDYIAAGVVTINGVVVTELGSKVMPTDEVKFNDSKVTGEKKVYLLLNKPKGYVTSNDDPHADKTVMDLVREGCTERIYPVGRLDKNSVGLLLFTNDGDLTKQLTHPSHRKKKIYQVSLNKPLTRADMESIAEGITLEDGDIFADEIAYVKEDDKSEVGIEIHSGRNRIVRRIFEHLGYTVLKLDRVYYAGLTKKNLKRGQWRFLTNDEVKRLKSGRYE